MSLYVYLIYNNYLEPIKSLLLLPTRTTVNPQPGSGVMVAPLSDFINRPSSDPDNL